MERSSFKSGRAVWVAKLIYSVILMRVKRPLGRLMRATLKRKRRLPERLITRIVNINKRIELFIHFICRCHCPAMDMKKLKKQVNLISSRNPEKTT